MGRRLFKTDHFSILYPLDTAATNAVATSV